MVSMRSLPCPACGRTDRDDDAVQAQLRQAEAAIAAVRALAERYDRADPDDIFRGVSIATEIEEALDVDEQP